MTRAELAQRIYATSYLTGQFRLRSGALSHEYFDKYQFESDPQLLWEVAVAMRALIPPGVEALAGLELGGIPLVTLLAQLTGLPALFVRKAPKDYGTCRLVEGGEVAHRHLVMVEDVVTSGGQILLSAHALRTLGAHIVRVVCVIDREAGGASALAAEELDLAALFRMHELQGASSQPV
jgi:orotate phosphoribosyltransferase